MARFFIFSICFIFCTTAFSQPVKADPNKDLYEKFPEDKCISPAESLVYSFAVKKTTKKSQFQVKEDYTGTFITGENSFTRINSVFYDDYSEISALKCKINQQSFSNFPVIYTNYESEGIFHDDIKVCAYKMEMSKDKTYEVNYTKVYNNPRLFSRIFFSNNYPVHKRTLTFEIPDWVEVEFREINFEGYNITKKEIPVPAKKIKQVVYEATDLAAMPQESHMPGIQKVFPHLLVFIKSNSDPKAAEKYFASQQEMYKWCKLLVDSVNNEPESLREVFNEIKKNETDSFKLMEKIFYWVQDHVRYIAFENGIMGYKPMPAKKVCNMLYGDCKGMANLTKNLLLLGGIKARLTWIGTNDIPYNNDLPTLAVYNHMICTAYLGGKKYFLDATEQYIAVNDYAERIQGRPVMIENGDAFINDKIPSYDYKRNNQDEQCELTVSGNTLKGKGTILFNGETKTNLLRRLNSVKSENKDISIRNFLRSGNQNIVIKNYKAPNLDDRSRPISISYEYELSNAFYTVNNELLIMPEKDFDFRHLDFDSTRRSDYEFNYRYNTTFGTKINIPAGYTIKTLPPALTVKNDTYEIKMSYETNGTDAVTLHKTIIIKNILLKKSQFSEWNANIKKLNAFYAAPVILTKK